MNQAQIIKRAKERIKNRQTINISANRSSSNKFLTQPLESQQSSLLSKLIENDRVDPISQIDIFSVEHKTYARILPSQHAAPLPDEVQQPEDDQGDDDQGDDVTPKKSKKGRIRRSESKSRKNKKPVASIDVQVDIEEDEVELSPEYKLLQDQVERHLLSSYAGLMKWDTMSERIKVAELQNLFFPESVMISEYYKTYISLQFLEDEGFYVQTMPQVMQRNTTKLEYRLRKSEPESGAAWFSPSQRLELTSIPWKQFQNRPFNSKTAIDYLNSNIPDAPSKDALEALDDLNEIAVRFKENTREPFAHLVRSDPSTETFLRKATQISKYQALPPSAPSYTLLFNIHAIHIKDHPLMTDELRISKECVEVLNVLNERLKSGIISFLDKKLTALKTAYAELKIRQSQVAAIAVAEDDGIFPAKPSASFYERKKLFDTLDTNIPQQRAESLKFMLEDIRATRLLRDTEIQTDLILEFQILKKWERVKHLRVKQGYTTSPLKVMVKALVKSYDEDVKESSRECENEIDELRDLHKVLQDQLRQEHQLSLLSSRTVETDTENEEMEIDNGQDDGMISNDTRKKKNGRRDLVDGENTPNDSKKSRKLKDRLRTVSANSSPLYPDRTEGAVEVPASPRLKTKSKKSKKNRRGDPSTPSTIVPFIQTDFDEPNVRDEIRTRLRSTRRIPGSPSLSIFASQSEIPTEAVLCSQDEVVRKRCLAESRIYLKLFYNEHQITQTQAKPLDPIHFQIQWRGKNPVASEVSEASEEYTHSNPDSNQKSTVLSVRVSEVPESIKAEIYEVGVFGDALVGECYIAIPAPTETASTLDKLPASLTFTGRSFKPSYLPQREGGAHDTSGVERWVTGILHLNVLWAVDDDGLSLGPSNAGKHEGALKSGQFSVDPLKQVGPAGTLSIRKLMDWVVDVRIDPNDPRNQNLHRLKQLVLEKFSGALPLSLITDSIGKDTANSDQEVLKKMPFHLYWKSKKYFRLGLPQEFVRRALLLDDKAEESKARNKLIELRWKKEVQVGFQIPFDDKDIRKDMFDKEFDLLDNGQEISKFLASTTFSPRPVLSKKLSISHSLSAKTHIQPPKLRFLKQIRSHQLLKNARRARPKRVEDYVREQSISTSDPTSSFFGDFFSVRRPLKPKRLDASHFSSSTGLVASAECGCKIRIQVLRGFNVPVRSTTKAKYASNLVPKQGVKEPLVQSYVEATFQRRRARTSVADGPNPNWNEALVLQVLPPKNPDSEVVQQNITLEDVVEGELASEMIYLNLFDQLVFDMNEDDRDAGRRINKRIERNWLGTLAIPFSTIHERIKIDGVFSVDMPPVTLGYERNAGGDIENAVLVGIDTTTKSTLLHLFITMEPPLPQPGVMKLHFQSNEEDSLLRYIAQWVKLTTLRYPQTKSRIFKTTALDLEGRTTLVTRFIRAQNPPPGEFGSSVERIIRYVSRVPYLSSRVLLSADGPGLWCSTAQLLEIRAADSVEHAILLCNLLTGLGRSKLEGGASSSQDPANERKVYIVLGKGYEGNVAFVMMREKVTMMLSPTLQSKKIEGLSDSLQRIIEPKRASTNVDVAKRSSRLSLMLINPVTGESFSAGDPYIPIKEIGCVIDATNVWCNVQSKVHPGSINWDLSAGKCWITLISKSSPVIDMDSIQDEVLVYKNLASDYITNLETLIEKCLVSKIEKWRSHRTTRWNRLSSRAFKLLIQKFEDDLLSGIDISTHAAYRKELSQLRSVYHVNGFPLNMAYTDVDSIIEAVFNTDVHSCGDPLVEFAVAVSCKGFPGKFVSVWVYIANLTR